MGLFQAFNISASGMTAERFRTDIIAQNIANVKALSACSTLHMIWKMYFRRSEAIKLKLTAQ